MIRILSLVITIILVGGAGIFLTGYNTSESYSSEINFTVPYSKDLVWQELFRISETPNRKKDVESVEVLEEYGKLVVWKENLKHGEHRIYRTNKIVEKEYAEIELIESSYGLTGVWIFRLNQAGADTEITIYEESTLTETMRRGYRVIFERDHDLLLWQKYIKVGLVQVLLITP